MSEPLTSEAEAGWNRFLRENDLESLPTFEEEYNFRIWAESARVKNADARAQGGSVTPEQFMGRINGRLEARAQMSIWLLPELTRLGQAIVLAGTKGPEVPSSIEAATRLMALSAQLHEWAVAEQQSEEPNETAVVDGPPEGGGPQAPTDATDSTGRIGPQSWPGLQRPSLDLQGLSVADYHDPIQPGGEIPTRPDGGSPSRNPGTGAKPPQVVDTGFGVVKDE